MWFIGRESECLSFNAYICGIVIELSVCTMKRITFALIMSWCAVFGGAQDIVHPPLGNTETSPGGLRLTLVNRWQNWDAREKSTYTGSIISPKSVNIHPSGQKVYVNSLEGALTVVFDADSKKELKRISHVFDSSDRGLWAPPSGYYPFTHYTDRDVNTFRGRPVESAFSHGGRYLWVPYYRRSFDINAQDPSAVAVIDTRSDSIVRLLEAGVLPKMIAVSPDSRRVAIAHWGDNTVGYIDISSPNPQRWRHLRPFTVDRQLKWDLSMTEPVNRDSGSGNALRGTVFTPDGRYLLVACMGGNGGIAVIDTQTDTYLGKLYGMLPNVRHIIISKGRLYMSVNTAGRLQSVSLTRVMAAIARLRGSAKKSVTIDPKDFVTTTVGKGARTIVASPRGRFIFVACNLSSSVDVVDTKTMRRVLSLSVDCYPVGMDISADGRTLYVTSQGRKDRIPSGNCVDIIRIDY